MVVTPNDPKLSDWRAAGVGQGEEAMNNDERDNATEQPVRWSAWLGGILIERIKVKTNDLVRVLKLCVSSCGVKSANKIRLVIVTKFACVYLLILSPQMLQAQSPVGRVEMANSLNSIPNLRFGFGVELKDPLSRNFGNLFPDERAEGVKRSLLAVLAADIERDTTSDKRPSYGEQILEVVAHLCLGFLIFVPAIMMIVMLPPNDPSSATRRTGRNDCNRDAPAGFAAAHG
jgi:hypothetical protein